jgi:hypothetical protein
MLGLVLKRENFMHYMALGLDIVNLYLKRENFMHYMCYQVWDEKNMQYATFIFSWDEKNMQYVISGRKRYHFFKVLVQIPYSQANRSPILCNLPKKAPILHEIHDLLAFHYLKELIFQETTI